MCGTAVILCTDFNLYSQQQKLQNVHCSYATHRDVRWVAYATGVSLSACCDVRGSDDKKEITLNYRAAVEWLNCNMQARMSISR